MGKSGAQQQTQKVESQQGTTNPWAAAQPMLQGLIDKFSGLDPSVTENQTSALDNLNSVAAGLPTFSGDASKAISNMFGSSTEGQVGMLNDALSQLHGNIGGIASGAELDPYKTPGFSDAIQTMTDDITKNTKGVYAASGRAPSGAGSFAGSLGRGLTQGIAPVIASQFNTNNAARMKAAGDLFAAGGSTAGAITGQKQIPLTNAMTGMGSIGMLQQLLSNPANIRLNAANTQASQPFQNLGMLLDPALKLGGMGAQTTGNSTGTSTTTQKASLMSDILGGTAGAIGLLSFLSDERAKEEIEPVGKLFDGQTIHRYRYKGDPRMQIGLLAQEVDEIEPDAVDELPQIGLLAVNYRKATDRAASMRRAA